MSIGAPIDTESHVKTSCSASGIAGVASRQRRTTSPAETGRCPSSSSATCPRWVPRPAPATAGPFWSGGCSPIEASMCLITEPPSIG